MNFGYEQGGQELMNYFNDCEESINDLICDGYLEEGVKEMFGYDEEDLDAGDDLEYVQTVAQAVIDKLEQTAEDEETDYPELYEEDNDVLRATMVMDMHLWFNQFLEYRWIRNGVSEVEVDEDCINR